ncbi:protein vestigial [Zerene cesonia]|uniref:protein vestigial n=1 Tax=Zerene cesonia TaxID=33412 RepID=UPI0018E5948E|nr:protein vestigial [Zerene cesonia]
MAVSCPEVMYGAYYPYLYGRGAARSFHHAPHFQYDRLNVQSASNADYSAVGGAALSSGSASSGAQSPSSPPHAHGIPHHAHGIPHHAHAHAHTHAPHHSPRLRTKEEDLSAHGRTSADGGGSSESEGECGAGGRARAQYVSANCVVFTHYSGDVAAVVDEHFARALSIDKPKEAVPMASRNLPASFFNAAASGPSCAGLDLYDYDPWHQHYAGYGHAAHRHAAEYHAAAAHHNMAAAGYGGLLLGRGSLSQYKPVEWGHAHHAQLDPAACSPYSYPPPGLEAQVQDTSKDLYWF